MLKTFLIAAITAVTAATPALAVEYQLYPLTGETTARLERADGQPDPWGRVFYVPVDIYEQIKRTKERGWGWTISGHECLHGKDTAAAMFKTPDDFYYYLGFVVPCDSLSSFGIDPLKEAREHGLE